MQSWRDSLVLLKINKSLECSSMKLKGTLSSILAMKTMYPECSTQCYHWKPTDDILKISKKQPWIRIKNKSNKFDTNMCKYV